MLASPAASHLARVVTLTDFSGIGYLEVWHHFIYTTRRQIRREVCRNDAGRGQSVMSSGFTWHQRRSGIPSTET
ncbi:hypothetical protein BaRGS_00031532, partial [Batillaria attramentaria]